MKKYRIKEYNHDFTIEISYQDDKWFPTTKSGEKWFAVPMAHTIGLKPMKMCQIFKSLDEAKEQIKTWRLKGDKVKDNIVRYHYLDN